MIYQILNGDALIKRFLETNITGVHVVARECLIEGDLQGDTLAAFWQNRARYLAGAYPETEEDYYQKVVAEFNKLLSAPTPSEFNLWFGYDLFCQANMWFVISVLHSLPIEKEVFVVYPSFLAPADVWDDFGSATILDLQKAFHNRVPLTNTDLELGNNLWLAFKNNDLLKLAALSQHKSSCFPFLKEVCQAHIDRFPKDGIAGRPERIIRNIMQNISTDFSAVFVEFSRREGVYGFGDSQVKQLYDNILPTL